MFNTDSLTLGSAGTLLTWAAWAIIPIFLIWLLYKILTGADRWGKVAGVIVIAFLLVVWAGWVGIIDLAPIVSRFWHK